MQKGVIAAGHLETARAGAEILRSGGNAFDAAVGALLASCVCEPTYVSAGGGGFMLAHSATGKTVLYDFFAQTPQYKRPENEVDFRQITLNFGSSTQDFHIGLGAVAIPGNIAGAFYIHRQLGRMPFAELAAPALALAKQGVSITPFIHYTMHLLGPILTASAEGRAVFNNPDGHLKAVGDTLFIPDLYDALFTLTKEGERLFYEGEMGRQLVADCLNNGGYITLNDLKNYHVIERRPIQTAYRNKTIYTNPPPCTGGALIAFALQLLQRQQMEGKHHIGTKAYMQLIAEVFYQTNIARKYKFDNQLHNPDVLTDLLHENTLKKYSEQLTNQIGNTTHISVADAQGNTASLTHSAGAGNCYFIPQTGIMLNNMLGEADLNPTGFHKWINNSRLSSMMSPTLLIDGNGDQVALGSSGSSRIRSAMVQVISHLADFELPLQEAINLPRLHLENKRLNIEYGFNVDEIAKLALSFECEKISWQQQNMYFGGVNAVSTNGLGNFTGAADERRSGVAIVV